MTRQTVPNLLQISKLGELVIRFCSCFRESLESANRSALLSTGNPSHRHGSIPSFAGTTAKDRGIENMDLCIGNAARIDYRRNDFHELFSMPSRFNLPNSERDMSGAFI